MYINLSSIVSSIWLMRVNHNLFTHRRSIGHASNDIFLKKGFVISMLFRIFSLYFFFFMTQLEICCRTQFVRFFIHDLLGFTTYGCCDPCFLCILHRSVCFPKWVNLYWPIFPRSVAQPFDFGAAPALAPAPAPT